MCITVPRFEAPDAFVDRLRSWQTDPALQPDIELWYNNTGKAFLERPIQLWSITQQVTLQQTLNKAEKEIAPRSTEKAYIIDSQGNILLQKEGGKNYVEFTPEEVKLLTGNTFTHNHPRGTSFSFEDVSLATRYNASEMRAVGSEYTHSITPGASGWPEHSTLAKNYTEVDYQLRMEFFDKINNDEMTVDQAARSHQHEVWSRLSNILDVDYKRFFTEMK